MSLPTPPSLSFSLSLGLSLIRTLSCSPLWPLHNNDSSELDLGSEVFFFFSISTFFFFVQHPHAYPTPTTFPTPPWSQSPTALTPDPHALLLPQARPFPDLFPDHPFSSLPFPPPLVLASESTSSTQASFPDLYLSTWSQHPIPPANSTPRSLRSPNISHLFSPAPPPLLPSPSTTFPSIPTRVPEDPLDRP
ncbi:hypothetical protein IE53DRAFT_241221 [Violaceomyces palustris]|uniref:Uncharacterized protein n=1 Tax=Violaceomyces palustris TaxID=1673888 RepID=A0ACD0NP77_9BASI|nr:hypothetical protein IE53DRAFT_241221 [Violaceomyces palustris]